MTRWFVASVLASSVALVACGSNGPNSTQARPSTQAIPPTKAVQAWDTSYGRDFNNVDYAAANVASGTGSQGCRDIGYPASGAQSDPPAPDAQLAAAITKFYRDALTFSKGRLVIYCSIL